MIIWGSPISAASSSDGASLLPCKEVWSFFWSQGGFRSSIFDFFFLFLFKEERAVGGSLPRQLSTGQHLLPEQSEVQGGALPGAGQGVCQEVEGQVRRERVLPLHWQGEPSFSTPFPLLSESCVSVLFLPCPSTGSAVSGWLCCSETFFEKGSIVGFSAERGQAVCEEILQIW